MDAPKASVLKALDRALRRAARRSSNAINDAARIEKPTDVQINRNFRKVAPHAENLNG